MTGEITLRGTVLPVGGIREKVTAAHRSGFRDIILPDFNKKDLEEIPKKVLKDMTFHFVKDVMQVVEYAFPNTNKSSGKKVKHAESQIASA